MTSDRYPQGLLDTNILILRRWIDPGELPAEVAITAITLAELSAGPHQVHLRPGDRRRDRRRAQAPARDG
jgi:predicted nucleic acid-binding protein